MGLSSRFYPHTPHPPPSSFAITLALSSARAQLTGPRAGASGRCLQGPDIDVSQIRCEASGPLLSAPCSLWARSACRPRPGPGPVGSRNRARVASSWNWLGPAEFTFIDRCCSTSTARSGQRRPALTLAAPPRRRCG